MADPTVAQQAPDIYAVAVYYFPKLASLGVAPLLYAAKQVYSTLADILSELRVQNDLLRRANQQRETAATTLATTGKGQ